MTNEQIVQQLQQIVMTLQRIVTASGELAERVTALESHSAADGPLTAIQGSLTLLLEQIQKQGEEQTRINAEVALALGEQEQRIAALETESSK